MALRGLRRSRAGLLSSRLVPEDGAELRHGRIAFRQHSCDDRHRRPDVLRVRARRPPPLEPVAETAGDDVQAEMLGKRQRGIEGAALVLVEQEDAEEFFGTGMVQQR